MEYNHLSFVGVDREFSLRASEIKEKAQIKTGVALIGSSLAIAILMHIIMGEVSVLSVMVSFIVIVNIGVFLRVPALEYVYSRTARNPLVMKWAVYNNMRYLMEKYGEYTVVIDNKGLFSIVNEGGKYTFPQVALLDVNSLTGNESLQYDVEHLKVNVISD